MSSFEIVPKQKILCKELNTGKEYNGFFYFDDKTIKAEICSFDESFYIKEENPIFLRSEKNHIISLHSNISSPPGSCSRNIEPKMITYKQSIISDVAVIGHDKWGKDDLIKRVSFSIKHSDDLFKHRKTYDEYIKRKFTGSYKSDIFSVTVNHLRISVNYCATFTSEFDEPREIWTRVEIEFEEPLTLYDYVEHVLCVVRFLSLCLGIPLTPSDFKICRLSLEDMVVAVDSNSYAGDYSIEYVWPEIDFYDSDLWIGGSLVIAYDDEELEALKNCLIAWVGSHEHWRKASIQMMNCLSLNGEISSDRLLAACKWFEEIPLTQSQNAISDEHIKTISNVASEKASELGYSDIKKRISGSLKSIKSETHEDRFIRLVKMAKDKYGLDSIDDEIITYLKEAVAFRGKAAHGHFSPSNDEEFCTFTKSIYAMEALCFLITAYDLPINDSGVKRMHYHPFIQHYRLS
jgi:ApeA N-terminal domain 1